MTMSWHDLLYRRRTRLVAAGVALVTCTGVAISDGKPIISDVEDITIAARRIESFEKSHSNRTRYGELEWRGGLALTSSHPSFGGWSGLAIDPDGHSLLAISDAGAYLTADLVHKGSAPVALKDARIGPIRAINGKPLTKNRDRDAESVALIAGDFKKGVVLISFERNGRIGKFAIENGDLRAPTGYFRQPRGTRRGPGNEGIEALTIIESGANDGAIVGIEENPVPGKPGHAGWIWVGGQPKSFSLAGLGDYSVTDAATLSDGTVFLLERRFRWTDGVRMRLRRIAPGAIGPGKTVQSEVLLSADLNQEIDNMEGLAVRELPSGEVILTLISDDNFNTLLQRTVLLEFALPGRKAPKEAAAREAPAAVSR